MDTERLNDLANLMNEDLSEDERVALSEKIALDNESSVLMGVLCHPTLSSENNADLPFEIGASFLGGWCQDYVRSVGLQNLSYGRKSVNFLAHLGRILGTKSIHCFRKRFDLNFSVSEEYGALQISPEIDGDKYSLYVNHQGPRKTGSIEVWVKGNLIRKSKCTAISEHPIQGRRSGTAVSIRHSDSPMGVEILLSEIEFSQEDWKRACLAACIEGQFGEGLRILKSGKFGLSSGQGRLGKVVSHLSALSALTRSEGMALAPLPASRSVSIPIERRLEAYRPVWEGITATIPQSENIPNPWNDESWDGQYEPESLSDFEPAAKELIEACFRAFRDPSATNRKVPDSFSDGRIDEGWSALVGWTQLLMDHPKEAYESFVRTKPFENDPFGLLPGAALAKHLILSRVESVSQEDIEVSSDIVLRETFSSIL